MKNADRPAMPNPPQYGRHGGILDLSDVVGEGLTKREHFAGLAMQGMLSNRYFVEHGASMNEMSAMARNHADDLLAALEES